MHMSACLGFACLLLSVSICAQCFMRLVPRHLHQDEVSYDFLNAIMDALLGAPLECKQNLLSAFITTVIAAK